MESCADLCLLSCLLALAIAASICRLSAPVSRLAVDNALYLLVQFFLPREGRIEVVCFIGAVLWADEIHPDHIAKDLFQRQSLFFIHGKQKQGSMTKIMQSAAALVLICYLSRKNSGTPISAPPPKQISCRLVRFKKTLLFTAVRSFGTGT